MEYRYGSHTIYNIEYHFVWVTKYRYQVLTGDIGLRVRELVRQSCEAFEIRILKGVVSKDYIPYGQKTHPYRDNNILTYSLPITVLLCTASNQVYN